MVVLRFQTPECERKAIFWEEVPSRRSHCSGGLGVILAAAGGFAIAAAAAWTDAPRGCGRGSERVCLTGKVRRWPSI